MVKDKDKKEKEKDPFSDSGELFESIFRDAIATEESKKETKAGGNKPKSPAPEKGVPKPPPPKVEKPVQKESSKKGLFKKAKKPDKPRKPEKPEKPQKPRRTKAARPKKGSGSRNVFLLILLLLVFGAGLFFYGDTLGLGGVKDTLSGTLSSIKEKVMGPQEPQVAMTRKKTGRVKKEGAPRSEKGAARPGAGTAASPPAPVKNPKIESPQKSKSAIPPTPSEKAAPGPKVAKAPASAVKTPAPGTAPQKAVSESSGKSPAKPSPKPKPAQTVKPPLKGAENQKALPVPKREKEPESAVKTPSPAKGPQRAVSQPAPPTKPMQGASVPKEPKTAKAPEPAETVQKRKTSSSYPYSVYLASYKTLSRAKRAVAVHQAQGLSPYWVKVHLGSKGVWYRIFAGHFESREAAEAFVRENKLEEAKVKHTRYTNLIGVYSNIEDLRSRSFALLEQGYCPYAIPEGNGDIGLYAGAFITKAGAEMQQRELASKGIQNQVITR
jgi:hypothetical protein